MRQFSRPLILWALYLAAASCLLAGVGEDRPASPAASSASSPGWDNPDQPYSQAAVTEGGWVFFSGVIRTSSGAGRSLRAHDISAHSSAAWRPLLIPNDLRAFDARPHIRTAKCGDDGSCATTIPPPSV